MSSKKGRVILIFTFILSIALFQNVYAATLVLQPDGAAGKDALVTAASPDSNFGTDDNLTINFGGTNHGLIEFDISAIPPGSFITIAKLEVLEELNCPHNLNAIEVHLNSASWDEMTVTWNNAPAYGSSIGTNSGETSSCDLLNFDVTSAIQDWVDGINPNYGFRLTGPGDGNVIKYIWSSDRSTAAERPVLTIDYEEGAAPPPTPPATPVPTMSAWGLGILAGLFIIIGFRQRKQFFN